MSRYRDLEQFFIECCQSSSIYFDGRLPSIKYLCNTGKVLFVERSRMLDYREVKIPDYNKEIDEPFIYQIINRSEKLMGCESHSHGDCHYCLTISLKSKE